MKLRSQEKLQDVQIRVKVKENIAEELADYVTYANTELGHSFDDVKELAAEIFRAFVQGDRKFQAWLKGGREVKPKVGVKKKAELSFADGLGVK